MAQRLSELLSAHVRKHRLGFVPTAETGFLLGRKPDTVRAPDVAFVTWKRHRAVGPTEFYYPGPPDLAAEVLSPDDRPGKVQTKVQEWLTAGCRLVWVIDPRRRCAVVHRRGIAPRALKESDDLVGGRVVPGFRVQLAELFEF